MLIAALRHHPNIAGLLTALTQIYLEDGLPGSALTSSCIALAQNPDNSDLLALVGSQLSVLGSRAEPSPRWSVPICSSLRMFLFRVISPKRWSVSVS
ncbi:hypothetical protein PY650_26965 [Rhizobium calliandrae]|uniref:Uncharacterized protein n=1 Tax=Rhizobium calliandrae TaxID=1312182 RepID=A0ABT7KLB3_9HYPH|nr:hypothetical protein [Rhizobium calliandrae]MDL2409211.1 hypothetical protein [Rhizobium calliandrae]